MPEEPLPPPFSEFTIAGKRIVRVQRWSRRRSVRGVLFLLLAFVSVLALVSSSKELFLLWKVVLAFDLLFVLWPFFQGTYLLYTRGSVPIHVVFRFTDASFFKGLPEFQVSPLLTLGFTFAGCLTRDSQIPGVTTELALLVHTEQEDSVQVAQIRNSLGTRGLLVFATKFDDGLVVETSNYGGPRLSKPKPKFRSFQFPQVRHIPDLYLLHTKLKEEFSPTRTPMKFSPSERINAYIEDAEEIHRLNLAQGDYQLHSSGDRYVYTFRGAMRQTFLRTWPVGAIRAMSSESASFKEARRLGFALNPKLGIAIPLKITVPRTPNATS